MKWSMLDKMDKRRWTPICSPEGGGGQNGIEMLLRCDANVMYSSPREQSKIMMFLQMGSISPD